RLVPERSGIHVRQSLPSILGSPAADGGLPNDAWPLHPKRPPQALERTISPDSADYGRQRRDLEALAVEDYSLNEPSRFPDQRCPPSHARIVAGQSGVQKP